MPDEAYVTQEQSATKRRDKVGEMDTEGQKGVVVVGIRQETNKHEGSRQTNRGMWVREAIQGGGRSGVDAKRDRETKHERKEGERRAKGRRRGGV